MEREFISEFGNSKRILSGFSALFRIDILVNICNGQDKNIKKCQERNIEDV